MTGRGEHAGGEGPEKSPGYLHRKGHRSRAGDIINIHNPELETSAQPTAGRPHAAKNGEKKPGEARQERI